MRFLTPVLLFGALSLVCCRKSSVDWQDNAFAGPGIAVPDQDFFDINIDKALQEWTYFRLRKANGADRFRLLAGFPGGKELNLFGTPFSRGRLQVYDSALDDPEIRYSRSHAGYFSYYNDEILSFYDIDNDLPGSSYIDVLDIDTVARRAELRFVLQMIKVYDLGLPESDTLLVEGHIRCSYRE